MTSHQPTQLGPYRIRSRLAVGGMAEVFLARRVMPGGKLGPKVAVKRLLPHLLEDAAVVRMFLNEARITAQIVHPNVVRILEVGDDAGQPFIAMELLDGGSFAQLREKAAETGKRVPLGVALRVLIDACRGLDAAHRATDDSGQPLCIVHRDFTPDNVHVGVSGAIKVIDFGIAKSSGLPGGTEPGTLKGKYFYMSPEMIRGEPLDHRADVFAAGVMLYEQLCGHRPFTGNSTAEILARIARESPRRPTELDPSVPLSLELTCLRALSCNPEDRFASLADLADALESLPDVTVAPPEELGAYVNTLFPRDSDARRVKLEKARAEDPSLPPHRTSALDQLEPPARRSRAAWMIALVVLAGGAGAGGYRVWQHRAVPSPAQRIAEARRHADGKGRLGLAHLDEDPHATDAQLSEAGHLLLSAHADRAALELATGFARRAPKDVDAPLIEAQAAIALRYGKRAEAALERARLLAPSDPRPDELRADLKTLQGDLPGALSAIEDASRKANDAPHLVVRQADLLVRLSRLDEARKVTSEALERGFEPEVAAEKAFVELQLGRTHDALALLRRVLRDDDSLAPAHYYLGAALEAQGDADGAEREYHAADRLAPDDTRALQALITLAQQRHRADEAQKLKQSLEARTAEAE